MPVSLLILTGQSGSGKTTTIRALEDQGYFCVDNIPPGLVEKLLEFIESRESNPRVAVVIDVREGAFLDEAPALVERLRSRHRVQVLYLESREDALIRRYSETRRAHPLDKGQGLRASISREREILGPMRELADETLDTSAMSPHELRAKVTKKLTNVHPGDDLAVALISFGFKHGLPLDADMVFDVRFLPNPYFDPNLRHLTGLDEKVRAYVLESEEGRSYVNRTFAYLSTLLPHFQKEGKRYLTLAVGCTGGQHRSVSIAHALSCKMLETGFRVDLQHRDVRTPKDASDLQAERKTP